MKKSSILFVLTLLLLSSFTINSAFANSKETEKPGWGYGDKNHIHIGPPGQSITIDEGKERNEIEISINAEMHNLKNSDIVQEIQKLFHNFFG